MTTTNLNINVVDKRMFKQSEAASYAGLPVKHFKAACPVRPVELIRGARLWDRRDLDLWIDDRQFRLEPGDSFRFAGERYRWRNPGTEPAVAIWVIAPPVY